MASDCVGADTGPPVPSMTMFGSLRPVLVIVPTEDRVFEAFVRVTFGDDRVTPAALQGRLRQRYPQAIVRPRELYDEPLVIWYVYRDGRWTPPDNPQAKCR